MRDITLEETVYFNFTTRALTGIPTTLSGSPALSVLESNNATPITSGVSLQVDRASVTGLNQATIVATAANGYEAGKSYAVYISTGTVDSVSVVGEVVAEFTVQAAAAFTRLGAPAGASVSADVAAIKTQTAAIEVDTNELQTDWANGGRLDLILDARASQTSVDTIDGIVDDILVDTAEIASIISTLGTPAGASVSADIAAVKSDSAAILVDTAVIGAAGAGLTAVPWNAAWDAEVQSEVADGLTAFWTSPATLVDLVWDEAIAGHAGAGSTGEALAGATAPSAAAVADAVWDEAISGHLGAGSTGEALNAAGAAGDPWTTTLPGAYGAGSAGYIIGTNINATISSRASQTSLDTVDGIVDSILVDTAEIGAAGAGLTNINLPDQTMNITGNLVGSVTSVTSLTSTVIADAVWDEAIAGHVGAGSTGEALNTRASQTSVDTIDDFLDTEIAAIKTKTDFLPSATAGSAGGILIAGANAATSFTGGIVITQSTADEPGLSVTGNGDGAAVYLEGGATGAGMLLVGATVALDLDGNASINGSMSVTSGIIANITGNLSGSVGSVTGLTNTTIADQVWDEAIAGHAGVGSTGEALNAAGAAGDPWTTTLPGAYGAGSAGYIIGTNINATVSSRASQTSLDTVDGIVDTILLDTAELQTDWANAGRLDTILDTIAADVVNVDGYNLATQIGTAGAGLTNIGTIATVTNLTNLPTIPANWLTAAGIAAGALDGKGNWNIGKTGYSLTATTGLGDQTANITGNLVGSVTSVTSLTNTTVADAVWDEAVAGHLTAGSTGEALNAAGAAGDPWTTALPGAYGAGSAGYIVGTNLDAQVSTAGGGLDAAGVRAAVGLASANLDTQLGAIDTVVDSILLDTAEIGAAGAGLTALATQVSVDDLPTNAELATALGTADDAVLTQVALVKAKTDLIPAAPAAVGDIPTATQNADALLNRDMSAVSDTNARTPLMALRFLRNKWSIAGTALTVTKEDDTTSAWTAVVTAAPGADPISGNDPA